jgi:hypothetical protein
MNHALTGICVAALIALVVIIGACWRAIWRDRQRQQHDWRDEIEDFDE